MPVQTTLYAFSYILNLPTSLHLLGNLPSLDLWYSKEPANFSVSLLGFVGHIVSVTTAQLCHHSMKAAIDNMETSGYISIKFYLQQARFDQWATVCEHLIQELARSKPPRSLVEMQYLRSLPRSSELSSFQQDPQRIPMDFRVLEAQSSRARPPPSLLWVAVMD